MKKPQWLMKRGKKFVKIDIEDMSYWHLKNAVRFLERKHDEKVNVWRRMVMSEDDPKTKENYEKTLNKILYIKSSHTLYDLLVMERDKKLNTFRLDTRNRYIHTDFTNPKRYFGIGSSPF